MTMYFSFEHFFPASLSSFPFFPSCLFSFLSYCLCLSLTLSLPMYVTMNSSLYSLAIQSSLSCRAVLAYMQILDLSLANITKGVLAADIYEGQNCRLTCLPWHSFVLLSFILLYFTLSHFIADYLISLYLIWLVLFYFVIS